MGLPHFLKTNPEIMEEWIHRGFEALNAENLDGVHPSVAEVAASDLLRAWDTTDEFKGEAQYLELLWEREPGGWAVEHMFWQFVETTTRRYTAPIFRDAFEILGRAEYVHLDEWGV